MADIVYIRWEDAFSPSGGWQSKEEVDIAHKRRFLIDSVGLLLRCGEDGIVIAQGWTSSGETTYQNVLKVPSGWIHDLRKVGTVNGIEESNIKFEDLGKFTDKWQLKLGKKKGKNAKG